jgi:hypothetical protein
LREFGLEEFQDIVRTDNRLCRLIGESHGILRVKRRQGRSIPFFICHNPLLVFRIND